MWLYPDNMLLMMETCAPFSFKITHPHNLTWSTAILNVWEQIMGCLGRTVGTMLGHNLVFLQKIHGKWAIIIITGGGGVGVIPSHFLAYTKPTVWWGDGNRWYKKTLSCDRRPPTQQLAVLLMDCDTKSQHDSITRHCLDKISQSKFKE